MVGINNFFFSGECFYGNFNLIRSGEKNYLNMANGNFLGISRWSGTIVKCIKFVCFIYFVLLNQSFADDCIITATFVGLIIDVIRQCLLDR